MTKVIGVRFRTSGKVYFFDPLQLEIKRGDHVIVETARGIEFGTVVAGVHEVEDDKVIQPLKPVMRIAGERDIEQEAANKEKEKEAFKICKEKILKHGLEMKLIDAEYTFDNNKVLITTRYYSILQQTDVSTSVNWSRIWQVCSRPVSSCVRLVFVMRQRSAVVSASVEGLCAATAICRISYRYPSRWRRSRICP